MKIKKFQQAQGVLFARSDWWFSIHFGFLKSVGYQRNHDRRQYKNAIVCTLVFKFRVCVILKDVVIKLLNVLQS